MKQTVLTHEDYVTAAKLLQVDVPAVYAVADIECPGPGFLPDGRPVILFEAHLFSKLTRGKFDKTHPNVSSPRWNRSLYGATGAHQHDRLAVAAALNREAALKSCSWGKFQILGSNHALAGYSSVQDFVTAMYEGVGQQLQAFVRFLQSTKLDQPLRVHDWARFARGYNGPAYAQNRYDTKLEAAWKRRGGR